MKHESRSINSSIQPKLVWAIPYASTKPQPCECRKAESFDPFKTDDYQIKTIQMLLLKLIL